jgi:hypothetical protein
VLLFFVAAPADSGFVRGDVATTAAATTPATGNRRMLNEDTNTTYGPDDWNCEY